MTEQTTTTTIIRAPRGQGRHEQELAEVQVPDLWHLYETLKVDEGREKDAAMVLECWHLAQDLLWNLRESRGLS